MTLATWLLAPEISDYPEGESRPEAQGNHVVTPASTSDEAQAARDRAPIERVRAGESSAFEAVYIEHYTDLLDFAATLLRGRADARSVAEDVVQQVFSEIWERRTAWQPYRVRPALFRAVRHRVINVRQRTREITDAEPLQALTTPADGVALAELHELEQALVQAVSALPERRRTALLLRAVRQMSYAEIGEVLDVSEKGAFLLVSRARDALEPIRQRFAEGQLPEPPSEGKRGAV